MRHRADSLDGGGMEEIIGFLMSNFMLTFFVIAAIATAISVTRRGQAYLPEAAIAFFCLFVIGFALLYNFVMHVFFSDMAAAFIGWEDSPFQAEVGWASLGFAVVGFLAYKGGYELRLAAIVGPSIFFLGAALGHIYQIITVRNFAPGNAGVMLYTDILLPIVGAFLLWMRYLGTRSARAQSTCSLGTPHGAHER